MGKNVLVVSATESFTVRGLMMKLKTIGAESEYCSPKLSDVENKWFHADLIILYTDDTIDKYNDSLVYLKDHCIEANKQVAVIGSMEEYRKVSNLIPDSVIFNFFERPLDMEKFLDSVDKFFEESSREARRKSILIVDDDVSYMSMISDWLKDTYRVSLANSGMQAITWLAKNNVDLILLDYEMPITSGPQVLEMIRSDATTSSIPVMFLTGKGDKESIMRVLSLKPVGYLLKSIERIELRRNIANFFAEQIIKGM